MGERVRSALGYGPIDLYGSSYGTRVAELYMRRHAPATHAVILDGVTYPQQAIGPDTPLDGERALDLILAREAIRRGEVFTISQTTEIDPKFSGKFLASPSPSTVATIPGNYGRVLVTSLGFGGIHAAARLERTSIPAAYDPVRAPASSPAAAAADKHPFRFPAKVAPEEMLARAEPGVSTMALNDAAAAHGLFYPPDPGSRTVSSAFSTARVMVSGATRGRCWRRP